MRSFARFIVATFVALTLCSPRASAIEYKVEPLALPVLIGGTQHKLQTLIITDASLQTAAPLAIITHGIPKDQAAAKNYRPSNYLNVAQLFASQGYVAAIVMRRGFGDSTGTIAYGSGTCVTGPLSAFAAGAEDLRAAASELGKRPDIDGRQIIAVGSSVGGGTVLSLAITPPEGLKAVVNFSGGVRNATCPNFDGLPRAFETLGRKSRVPSLWLYSSADEVFPPDIVTKLDAVYRRAGGQSTTKIIAVPAGGVGHYLMQDGIPLYGVELRQFLRSKGLPARP